MTTTRAPAAPEAESLEKSLKDLNLTTNEMDKLGKAFKDPEFLRLFEEYAKEVSDPKVKAETDLYLRQIEAQGRAEEVYGKGVQLVTPVAAFVLKSKVMSVAAQQQQADTGAGAAAAAKEAQLPVGQKVFINICTSDKVERYGLKDATDPKSGRTGRHLSVPMSTGPKRMGTDKQGQPASVYDIVLHPESVKFAESNRGALNAVAEMALERVEGLCSCRLSRQWKRLGMRFKTCEGVAEPAVQSIRTAEAGAEAVGGRLRPRPDVAGADVPGAVTAPPTAQSGVAAEAGGAEGGSASSRSNFSFDRAGGQQRAKQPQAAAGAGAGAGAAPKDPSEAGHRHPDGGVTPQWTLVHRGEADLAEAWGDAGRGLGVGGSVPKELLVRVSLPDLTSAASVDLDVGERRLALKVPGRYHLAVPLPYGIDESKSKAKFDKARRQLEITLPVLPPPPPAPRPIEAARGPVAEAEPGVVEAGAAAVGPVAEEGVAEAAGAEADGPTAGAEGSGSEREGQAVGEGGSQQRGAGGVGEESEGPGAESAVQAEGEPLTENERRWREVHAAQHAADAATASAAAAAGEEAAEAEAAPAAAVEAPQELPAGAGAGAPAVLLRPRLRHELAMELE